MGRPCCFFVIAESRARPYVSHIHDPVPLAIKLADLLLVDFQQQGDGVILLGSFGVHRRKIETPARSRVQNAHQRALCIAITDMKDLHSSCSLKSIRLRKPSPKAPLPPEPWGKRSLRERNQIPVILHSASAGSSR